METIIEYVAQEGGQWIKWPDKVDNKVPNERELKELNSFKHRATNCEIERKFLGSCKTIFMRLASFKTNKNRTWDYINGWRT